MNDTLEELKESLNLTKAEKNYIAFTVNNPITINVDGNKPDDLEGKLRKNNENLIRMIKEEFRRNTEDERRLVFN